MAVRRSLPSRLLGAALLLWASFAARGARADDPPPARPPDLAGPDAKIRTEVVRIVDELRADASSIRGLQWKTKVEADLLTRAQLAQWVEQMLKEEQDPKELERELKVMRRIGLLSASQDPVEMTKKYYALGIMGYYDTKTKKLYLIDGLTGDAQRPAILHELIHALEDQYLDFDKVREAFKTDQDRTFAFDCVVEGSAEVARGLYEQEHPAYGRMYAEEQAKTESADELTKAAAAMPAVLYVPSQLQYQIGPAVVGRYVGRGAYAGDARAAYADGIAALYADLPVSEEQVLHPGKFVGDHRDLPRKVTWPEGIAAVAGEGWTALEREPFGELDVAFWLERWLGGAQGRVDSQLAASGRYWGDATRTATEGWDGAWLQLLEYKGEPRAYVVASAWDTPRDAREAGEAFLKAAKAQYGAKFKAGEWSEKDGVRTSSFEGAYGLARIEVKGDEVRIADGLPPESLERVFAALETARLEKDPKDTWTPENAPDPSAGAAWRHASGVAWRKPAEAWTVSDGAVAVFRKDPVELRVRVVPAAILAAAPAILRRLASDYPDLDTEHLPVSEVMVAGKGALRLEFESGRGAPKDAPRVHVVALLVPLGTHTLFVHTAVDAAKWAAAENDVQAAVSGFFFWD